jgi:hypothetical protein
VKNWRGDNKRLAGRTQMVLGTQRGVGTRDEGTRATSD